MKIANRVFLIFTICFTMSVTAQASVQTTNRWNHHTANTPDTAYDWTLGDYWENGTEPVDGCHFKIYPGTDSNVYIKTTDIAAQTFYAKSCTRFLGDVTVAAAIVDGKMNGGAFYSSGWHYGDVIFPESDYSTSISGPTFCGLVRKYGSKTVNVTSGSVNFRFDRYARSASRLRTDDLDNLPWFYIGNGTISFYTPAAADAVSGVWRLNAGSPFAYRVSDTAHALAAGASVTAGDALPEGVFLKHVFDDATVELSAPALSSGDFTLDFAAISPEFKATFPTKVDVVGGAGSGGVYLCAYRGQNSDAACVSFENGLNFAGNMGKISFGSDSATPAPAEILLGPLTGDCSNGAIYLRNAHLAFVDGVSFDAKHPVKMPAGADGGYTAVLSVTNGQSVSIASLGDFCGTIVKSGGGSLAVGLNDSANAGSFKVDGGTLEVVANASAGDGAIALKSLVLASGTSLIIPENGLTVETLAAEGAVTVSGGKITVLSNFDCDLRDFVFIDGGAVNVPVASDKVSLALDTGVGSVVGHPAFWLDASQPETLEFTTDADGVNHVTRWNDCRAGETMFCTNLVLSPTYVNGGTMAEKYVRIANCPGVTSYRDTQILVWNVPVSDIRAVFLVQDPTEGGGVILGRCSWRVSNAMTGCSDGGPYYRASYVNSALPIVDRYYTTPAVTEGRFFLNGSEVDGKTTGYLGKFMQLVEHHVNADLADAMANGVVADAFGGCYVDNRDFVGHSNGGMRIAEYIIYTNSLTHAERVSVAQYLSRKWLGRDVRWSVTDPKMTTEGASLALPGVEMRVPVGEEGAVASTAGGPVVKTGAGLLHVGGYEGSSIDVQEGELVLSAFDRKRFVPTDGWLHVDAAAEETLETEADGVTLSRWNGLSGLGESLVNHGTYFKAKVVENAMNGLPLVDLGPKGSIVNPATAAGLQYDGGDLSRLVRTGFAVYDSSAGGGAVFGSVGNGYPSRGLPHDRSSANIICDAAHASGGWCGIPALSNAVASGTAEFRRNGMAVDPFTTPFLLGPERFSFRYLEGRKTEHFGSYGQSSQFSGGVKIGELILFDRALTDGEMASVEAYLAKKWFDIDTPGYMSAAGDVRVAAGATLTVLGEGFTVESLSGGGTVDGDVTLEENGSIAVAADAGGAVGTLTVNGTLTLGGGTLTVPDGAGFVEPGEYVIVSAAKIVKGDGEWTLPSVPRRDWALYFSEKEIRLVIRRKGLFLICR